MIGQILDVYPEGEEAFRGCVIGMLDDVAIVVDLGTGMVSEVREHERDKPIIENIFEYEHPKGLDL